MNRFADQVCVVTGGGSGIGKVVAHRLASEGANVFIFERVVDMGKAAADEIRSGGFTADALEVDIADEESVQSGVSHVLNTAGKLDVMINCAGIAGPTNTKILDYTTEAFDEIYQVNLRGSYLMTKYAIQPMLDQGYGRILLYSSIGGKEGNPGMCGYAATKSAVIGLVKGVGKEYAESGVTVNGLAPAVIRTPMVDACDPAMVDYMTARIPMQRTGTMDEAAAISAFIVSKECSFCTGFVFDISGGRATY
jgi:3-oxoacyl-[acyl-carrier protein] reductase